RRRSPAQATRPACGLSLATVLPRTVAREVAAMRRHGSGTERAVVADELAVCRALGPRDGAVALLAAELEQPDDAVRRPVGRRHRPGADGPLDGSEQRMPFAPIAGPRAFGSVEPVLRVGVEDHGAPSSRAGRPPRARSFAGAPSLSAPLRVSWSTRGAPP